ncbi:hypothetical protein BUY79_03175 [Staphylococcus equorum]|nr:hypothetical protein BUY79_03175 [Staphylococcus equorum]PTF09266.1 hypothetical protein BUY81_13105 [Staphylococcus equorum]
MTIPTKQRERFSDYELLTQYNPYFISDKLDDMACFIKSSYDRQYPRLTNDANNVVYESLSVENVVFDLMQQKQDLIKYKIKSLYKLRAFRNALNSFDKQSQRAIMHYFESYGEYRPERIIKTFSERLYSHRNK